MKAASAEHGQQSHLTAKEIIMENIDRGGRIVHPTLPISSLIAASVAEMLRTWPSEVTASNLGEVRDIFTDGYPKCIEEHVGRKPLKFSEREIPGQDGGSIRIAIYEPYEIDVYRPALLFIHGGGLVAGHRFSEDLRLLDLALDLNSCVVSVEYRLAPENPYPAAVEDCYAAWRWLIGQVDELTIDPSRIVLVGESAGAGIAAALALLIRDRGGRQPAGQMLAAPMLDHRNNSPSVHQQDGVGIWDKVSNGTGWSAYLDPLLDNSDVPPYASPSLADELSGLPPAFIDAGDAEIFRDEAVQYAQRLWLAGVPAELHVWTGGCHIFYAMVPELPLASVVYATRLEWLNHVLSRAGR